MFFDTDKNTLMCWLNNSSEEKADWSVELKVYEVKEYHEEVNVLWESRLVDKKYRHLLYLEVLRKGEIKNSISHELLTIKHEFLNDRCKVIFKGKLNIGTVLRGITYVSKNYFYTTKFYIVTEEGLKEINEEDIEKVINDDNKN